MNNNKDYLFPHGNKTSVEISSFNWTSSPLGTPDTWPTELRITLSMLLSSGIPMLLLWGADFTILYNQAYASAFGTDSSLLGQDAAALWQDNWNEIDRLIQEADQSSKAATGPALLIPSTADTREIRDNWIAEYNIIRDTTALKAGILVIFRQDISSRRIADKLYQSNKRFQNLIHNATVGIILLTGPKLIVEVVNEMYGRLIDRQPSELLGRPLFHIIPEAEPHFRHIIEEVRNTGEPCYLYEQPYFVIVDGHKKEGFLNLVYQPYYNDEGAITGTMVLCHDITEQVLSRRKIESSEQRFRDLVSEAVVATAILTGPSMVLELANEAMLNIWARDKSIIGMELLEFMPELKEQAFPQILADVFATGEPYIAEEALVYLEKNGKMETVYMDFSYKPLRDETGEVKSILVMAADITDRVMARERLAQSEANLRNTILKAPVAMCILRGPKHIVEIANERMIELWGKTSADVLGRPLLEGLPEIQEQGFDKLLDGVITTGEAFVAQGIPVVLPRGQHMETVYVNFIYEAYREANNNITGVIAVATDVTAQVLAHKKIEASAQRVRSLVESAPFPIGVYTGREMRIELANQSIIDVWGKGNDVIGKLYTEILPELSNQQIFAQLDSVYTTGVPFHARNQRVDLVVDGKLQPFYFNYSFTPVYDADGKVYGVMNTAAEITDLVVAKQQVEQSEKNFRSMILQAPVAMCILLGPEHIVEVANELMLEIWGKPVENMINRPLFEGLPDAKEQGFEELLKHVYETGETFTASERPVMLKRHGKDDVVYQNFVYQPYRNAEGTILGVLAISVDVTPQVLARQKIEEIVNERTKELAAANANLQRSNAELEQFAYIASHDLQEPLRKVRTYAQMLEHSLGEIPEKPKSYFEKINNATARMATLIRDVLSYSQLSHARQSFEPVDLKQVLAGIVSDFELLIEQKNADIIIEDLPVLNAVPLQMSQLFGNLISNALKFSATDKKPVITITAEKVDNNAIAASLPAAASGYYCIQVKDNGIGFEQEYANQIFNIFQRLHGKGEYSGTGIGLALCKKIALNHNGDIYAKSAPGMGAAFTVMLPAG